MREQPELRIHGVRTSLRMVTAADLDLLAGWLADPEVYRWWGGQPVPREVVRQKYIGGRPGVYIQYWSSQELSEAALLRVQPGQTGGIDMYLIPGARDRGLGPDAARALVRYLTETLGWTRVTVDPAADNLRAHRAWAKAGFTFERDVPDHPDGPSILMVIEAPATKPS
jgi:aminoglycoside 6'-N-acetyltransferase